MAFCIWRPVFGVLSLASCPWRLAFGVTAEGSEGARSSSHPSYCLNFHSFLSNQAVSRDKVTLSYKQHGNRLHLPPKLAYLSLWCLWPPSLPPPTLSRLIFAFCIFIYVQLLRHRSSEEPKQSLISTLLRDSTGLTLQSIPHMR